MKAYALLGYPLAHSLSPKLHQSVFQAWDLPHVYFPWEITLSQLPQAVEMFRRNLAGFNVTAPYKTEIISYLDELHLSAEVYSAVNTVKNEGGKLVGYNTDGPGFMQGLASVGFQPADKRALILGAGGAARTVALELAHQGAVCTIAARDVTKAYAVQVFVEKKFAQAELEVTNIERIPRRHYDLVVNATPVGMGELQGQSPLQMEYLQHVDLVYDLIYNPVRTKLLADALRSGCRIINGLRMLVHQGIQAQEIWQEQKADSSLEDEILELLAKEIG